MTSTARALRLRMASTVVVAIVISPGSRSSCRSWHLERVK